MTAYFLHTKNGVSAEIFKLYLILWIGYQKKAGHFTLNSRTLHLLSIIAGRDRRTVKKWIFQMVDLDLVVPVNIEKNIYRFVGIRNAAGEINQNNYKAGTEFTSRGAVVLPVEFLLEKGAAWKAILLEAYKAKNIVYRNKKHKYLIKSKQKAKIRSMLKSGVIELNQGHFAYQIGFDNLGISKSECSRLKKYAVRLGITKFEKTWRFEAHARSQKDFDSFLRFNPAIRPFVSYNKQKQKIFSVGPDLLTCSIKVCSFRLNNHYYLDSIKGGSN